MERSLPDLRPDPEAFATHLSLVQAFLRREPGAHGALMTAARQDPEAVTTSVVTLGTVLLDIAAGAFALTTDEMLDKLTAGVTHLLDEPAAH